MQQSNTVGGSLENNMHPVTQYLQRNSIASLEAIGIFARWSTANPAKVSLNYDQILAKDGDELVELCRGLVLLQESGIHGEAGQYRVLARPMRRFYNYGQSSAAKIDWSTARYETKHDGTMCLLYWDPVLQEPCVATRSVPDADLPTPAGSTFAEMFWDRYNKMLIGIDLKRWGQTHTFVYELIGPDNQIVIAYEKPELIQLCCIEIETGIESQHTDSFRCFDSIEEAVAFSSRIPGTQFEGFVVRDAACNRVKLKSENYLAASHVISLAGSRRGILQLILNQQTDDVVPFCSQTRCDEINQLTAQLNDWLDRIQTFANFIPKNVHRKTAALQTQESEFAPWIGCVLDVWSQRDPTILSSLNRQKTIGGWKHSTLDKLLETLDQQ